MRTQGKSSYLQAMEWDDRENNCATISILESRPHNFENIHFYCKAAPANAYSML